VYQHIYVDKISACDVMMNPNQSANSTVGIPDLSF